MDYRFFNGYNNDENGLLVVPVKEIREYKHCGDAYQIRNEDNDEEDEKAWRTWTENYITTDGISEFVPNNHGCSWNQLTFPVRNQYTGEIFETAEQLVDDIDGFDTHEYYVYWDGHNQQAINLNELTEETLTLEHIASRSYNTGTVKLYVNEDKTQLYTIDFSAFQGSKEYLVEVSVSEIEDDFSIEKGDNVENIERVIRDLCNDNIKLYKSDWLDDTITAENVAEGYWDNRQESEILRDFLQGVTLSDYEKWCQSCFDSFLENEFHIVENLITFNYDFDEIETELVSLKKSHNKDSYTTSEGVTFEAHWDFVEDNDFISFISVSIEDKKQILHDTENSTDGSAFNSGEFEKMPNQDINIYATYKGATHSVHFGQDRYYFK